MPGTPALSWAGRGRGGWLWCSGRGKGSSGCQQHKREAGGRAPKINANLYRGKLFNLFLLYFFLSFFLFMLLCFALLCFTFFLSFFLSIFHSSSTTTCSERVVQRPFSPDTPPFRQRPLAPTHAPRPLPLAPVKAVSILYFACTIWPFLCHN